MSGTSGTYLFAPSLGETALYAFSMIGVRRTAVTTDHMVDARYAVNIMLAEWSNRGVNLWEVKLNTTALVQGTQVYPVPAWCAMTLDAYIETETGTSNPIDRTIRGISRSEWAQQPNKLLQAPPTLYWYDRLIAPTITMWPVPDGNGPYNLNYYYVSQIQDANFVAGQTVDIPYQWLRALATGLAAELCPAHAPDREQARRADAERAFEIAAGWNVENVPVNISPALGGYFR
jgi:hypothetical protein